MPRFFLSGDRFGGDFVTIDGDDARHISFSLRMAVGDSLTLSDTQGADYFCTITSMDGKSVTLRVDRSGKCQSEPPYRATLYQCVAKGDKMDTIIQKAVEFGVYEIVPVQSERCIAKLPQDGVDKKLARWQRIANEAAGQCGRGILPKVRAPISFADAVVEMKNDALALLCYEGEGTVQINRLIFGSKAESISFLIGPEGGIADGEVALAAASGISLCGLGRRILRTESASSFVLSCLSFGLEMD